MTEINIVVNFHLLVIKSDCINYEKKPKVSTPKIYKSKTLNVNEKETALLHQIVKKNVSLMKSFKTMWL